MAEKKELEITIGPDGEVQVLVKCIKGASCTEETKFLEEALGKKTLDYTATCGTLNLRDYTPAEPKPDARSWTPSSRISAASRCSNAAARASR